MKLKAELNCGARMVAYAKGYVDKTLMDPIALDVREVGPADRPKCYVVGKQHDIMMLIGALADMGEGVLVAVEIAS